MPNTPTSAHGPAPRGGTALTQRRILLVEDEPDVAAFLVDLLALEGWRVDIAAHGREALARLEWDSYDVVVSDLVMPEMDGAALYREVARRRPELLPRFIFVSGFADSDLGDFIRQARAPMISKPFRFEEIQQAISDVLATAPDAAG